MDSIKLFKLSFENFKKEIELMGKEKLESLLCFAYGFISSEFRRRGQ